MKFAVLSGMLLACAPLSAGLAARAITPTVRTAGELADVCAANPNQAIGDARINFCNGFAQGAVEVMLHDAGERRPFCFPSPTPTRTETMRQFVGWVRANSTRAPIPAIEGLYQFLHEKYPCGK